MVRTPPESMSMNTKAHDKEVPQGWQQRWWAVIHNLTLVASDSELEHAVLPRICCPARPTILAFVNAHALNTVTADTAFAAALLQSDHVFRDGAGMKTLLTRLGKDAGLNLNGTDLIPKLIMHYNGRRIALLGTTDPYLSTAVLHVQQHLAPDSSTCQSDGFQSLASYEHLCASNQPDLILLGMGMPKQELVAQRLREQLTHPCLIVCGGAIIDFMGGKVTRAPQWIRAAGMEWLFRLFREPTRLYKRYVLGNPLFIWRTMKLGKPSVE
jgi:exopolysaccharide biosynthesis WecB/TagA/CpsF family protein